MAIDTDFVHNRGERVHNVRKANLSYNPLTGANNNFNTVSLHPYPDFSAVSVTYSDGWSNLNSWQTGFTKRLSHRWEASGNYTLPFLKDANGAATGPAPSQEAWLVRVRTDSTWFPISAATIPMPSVTSDTPRRLTAFCNCRTRSSSVAEVFNLFNHAKYGSYVRSEASSLYGTPQQNAASAYQPRMLQLGFRVKF